MGTGELHSIKAEDLFWKSMAMDLRRMGSLGTDTPKWEEEQVIHTKVIERHLLLLRLIRLSEKAHNEYLSN